MEYYKRASLSLPEDFEQREVALHTFDGVMVRHLAVSSEDELRKLIISKRAAHVYISTASYDRPDAPRMDEKGWRRADLQFDIDVDHFEGCEGMYVICEDSVVPSKEAEGNCSKPLPIVSKHCIYRGLEEAEKLVKVLKRYFGIEESNIEVHFSGNRGFHVIARNTPYDDQGSDVRREMVDFITGNHLNLDLCTKSNCLIPSPEDPGWRGRLGEALRRLLPSGVSTWGEVNVDPEELISKAILIAKIDVDEQVTVDTSRLLRVPGSLHGKSGLRVTKVKGSFKYGPHLSPFYKIPIEVRSLFNMDIEVLGKRINLKKDERAELDGAIAVFLATKSLVEIIRSKRQLSYSAS
ncbi:hypothetical protein IPA_00745 [Ignicoccus pacificus DSM 13166]|uniref:DNA primase small subunit PriS n=1 Tax=Ignicoccus pacificus DSM 13166 TaxID=940294 RepID=A0A977PL67_9CREN|nr:hypothetical protein IPA_00745 [Ignicoccus pacificus DSM 13166]